MDEPMKISCICRNESGLIAVPGWMNAKPVPRLLTAEEACSTWGHGYEEIWFHADEGMPECKLLFEIVFINGEFVCADGDHGTIDPDTYNTPYNSRVWLGDAPPTDEQREKTPWKETTI